METLSADFKVNLQMRWIFFFLWLISDAPRCGLAHWQRNTNTSNPATLYLITEEQWHLEEGEERLHNEVQRSHSLEHKTGQVVNVYLKTHCFSVLTQIGLPELSVQ